MIQGPLLKCIELYCLICHMKGLIWILDKFGLYVNFQGELSFLKKNSVVNYILWHVHALKERSRFTLSSTSSQQQYLPNTHCSQSKGMLSQAKECPMRGKEGRRKEDNA